MQGLRGLSGGEYERRTVGGHRPISSARLRAGTVDGGQQLGRPSCTDQPVGGRVLRVVEHDQCHRLDPHPVLHERGGVELATESRALRRTGHFGDPRDDVQRQMRLADPQVDTVRFLDDLDAESAEPDESPHGQGKQKYVRQPGAQTRRTHVHLRGEQTGDEQAHCPPPDGHPQALGVQHGRGVIGGRDFGPGRL